MSRPGAFHALRRRRGWLWLGVGAGALLLVLRSQFQLSLVVGDSMLPTLAPGDLMVLNSRAYRNAEPRRGDIVVARYQSGLIVKRVVGLPGEVVEVQAGRLIIDGLQPVEPYRSDGGDVDIRKGRLAAGRYALLGDNRAISGLQSVHAVLGTELIVGRVEWSVRLWPSSRSARLHSSALSPAAVAVPTCSARIRQPATG